LAKPVESTTGQVPIPRWPVSSLPCHVGVASAAADRFAVRNFRFGRNSRASGVLREGLESAILRRSLFARGLPALDPKRTFEIGPMNGR